jgi:hypothetical protein
MPETEIPAAIAHQTAAMLAGQRFLFGGQRTSDTPVYRPIAAVRPTPGDRCATVPHVDLEVMDQVEQLLAGDAA